MTEKLTHPIDPTLDLVLERHIDVPVEAVWEAWTNPDKLKKWFTPAPWTTAACSIDLRPGGEFTTTMRSPDGDEWTGSSCYLEVVPNEKLVWTSALVGAYRPLPASEEMRFTATILMERDGEGTHYMCIARHPNKEIRDQHGEMGFQDGWGTALDQMVAMIKEG